VRAKSLRLAVSSMLILAGCAIHSPDHFYALSAQPLPTAASHGPFARQVSLHVTLPSLVDRGELVLTARGQVNILEHERWASPLLDQITSVLGQDLEARRADMVIANRNLEQTALPLSRISVEVVKVTAERGRQVVMEARWRVMDSISGNITVGRDSFSAPLTADDYAQVAAALSQCVAQLADALLAQIPAPQLH
jgi:uncharacterized protein